MGNRWFEVGEGWRSLRLQLRARFGYTVPGSKRKVRATGAWIAPLPPRAATAPVRTQFLNGDHGCRVRTSISPKGGPTCLQGADQVRVIGWAGARLGDAWGADVGSSGRATGRASRLRRDFLLLQQWCRLRRPWRDHCNTEHRHTLEKIRKIRCAKRAGAMGKIGFADEKKKSEPAQL